MSRPVLLAYCDPVSASAGEEVRFMVSCEGAASYACDIVRLLAPEARPEGPGLREEPVAAGLERTWLARRQRIDSGSYGMIEGLALDGRTGFALQAIVRATRLDGRRQAIIGAWHEGE